MNRTTVLYTPSNHGEESCCKTEVCTEVISHNRPKLSYLEQYQVNNTGFVLVAFVQWLTEFNKNTSCVKGVGERARRGFITLFVIGWVGGIVKYCLKGWLGGLGKGHLTILVNLKAIVKPYMDWSFRQFSTNYFCNTGGNLPIAFKASRLLFFLVTYREGRGRRGPWGGWRQLQGIVVFLDVWL